MVAGLLIVDWYATEIPLEGLAKNGIKWLFLSQFESGLAQHKRHDKADLLDLITGHSRLFEEYRSIP